METIYFAAIAANFAVAYLLFGAPDGHKIGTRTLYRYPFRRYPLSEKLYVYEQHVNVCGHRSARQDWWAEAELTGYGTYVVVGEWVKDNVGYNLKPGQDWCYPYQPLSTQQALELDRTVSVAAIDGLPS